MIARGLVDTHCHIDAYDNPLAILDQASAAGIHVICVTEDPGRYRLLRTRLGRRDGVDVALGYHPLHASKLATHELARFFRLLPQTSWVGEIGLDFSQAGQATRAQQLRVFDAILAEPQLSTRPVTVHSRGAEREVVSRLAQAQLPAILHWYTGPLGVVDDALAANLSFSINPAMIRSQKAAALLERLPPDRVLLETDGPFAKIAGRPARPTDLAGVLHHLSGIWQTSRDQTTATILANQRRLFI